MDKIKLIIADDHKLLREAWESIMLQRNDVEVVASVGNGQDVIDNIKTKKVDIVLMDINMPGMDGISATQIICNTTPWVKVLGLSMHSEAGYIKKILKAGAMGFLSKTASKEELFEAIYAVYKGEFYIHKSCSYKLASETTLFRGRSVHLTNRELEIVKLIIDGNTAKEIGEKLFISSKTVDSHKNNIFSKLNINNVASLTKMAVENGIVF